MKNFLRITAVAAVLAVTSMVQAQVANWPQLASTLIYTNLDCWPIGSNTLQSSAIIANPFAGQTSVSYSTVVFKVTTTYPQGGTNCLTAPTTGTPWGTNLYSVLPSLVYTSVTSALPPTQLFELTVTNVSTNTIIMAWVNSTSQVSSNMGSQTNNWIQLPTGYSKTWGGSHGFMPNGTLNALSLVAGTPAAGSAATNSSNGGLYFEAYGQ
jgi:hypothetical protein